MTEELYDLWQQFNRLNHTPGLWVDLSDAIGPERHGQGLAYSGIINFMKKHGLLKEFAYAVMSKLPAHERETTEGILIGMLRLEYIDVAKSAMEVVIASMVESPCRNVINEKFAAPL